MSAADQSRLMQDQMTGPAMGMPPDPSKAFKVSVCFFGTSLFFYFICLTLNLEIAVYLDWSTFQLGSE